MCQTLVTKPTQSSESHHHPVPPPPTLPPSRNHHQIASQTSSSSTTRPTLPSNRTHKPNPQSPLLLTVSRTLQRLISTSYPAKPHTRNPSINLLLSTCLSQQQYCLHKLCENSPRGRVSNWGVDQALLRVASQGR